MDKIIKIGIVDFWASMDEIVNEHIFQYMAKASNVEFTMDDPDVIYYSVYGNEHKKYSCYKIYYTGDNFMPDLSQCDYSFSFYPSNAYNFQLPVFVLFDYFQDALKNQFSEKIIQRQQKPKDRFCNFFYSNPKATERIDFFEKLSQYKKVDSPGKVCNNMTPFDKLWDWESKLDFISHYKFTIAFENEMMDHYTSEKIYHPLLVNSVPIYWGNKRVGEYFNEKAFINANDFSNFDELVNYVKHVDQNDDVYQAYLSESMFPQNIKEEFFEKNIVNRYAEILNAVKNKSHRPVSKSFVNRTLRKFQNQKMFS